MKKSIARAAITAAFWLSRRLGYTPRYTTMMASMPLFASVIDLTHRSENVQVFNHKAIKVVADALTEAVRRGELPAPEGYAPAPYPPAPAPRDPSSTSA